MRASVCCFAVVFALVAGCRKEAPPGAKAVDVSKAVVRVDDGVIDVAALEHHLRRMPPPARARYATPEGRKELVDNLVRFELLANEAKRRGIDRRPEVQRLVKQQMINILLDQQTAPPDGGAVGGGGEPSDEAAQAFYRNNAGLFQRGEQVRVAQVRVRDRQTAQKVAVAARRIRPGSDGFDKLVAQYSDDPASKDRGGDLGFFDRSSGVHSPTLVATAFALPEVGSTSDPVETDQGFHILRLTDKRPAALAPFDEVKTEVKARLAQQERDRQVKELVEDLRAKAKIEVFDERLQQVLTR